MRALVTLAGLCLVSAVVNIGLYVDPLCTTPLESTTMNANNKVETVKLLGVDISMKSTCSNNQITYWGWFCIDLGITSTCPWSIGVPPAGFCVMVQPNGWSTYIYFQYDCGTTVRTDASCLGGQTSLADYSTWVNGFQCDASLKGTIPPGVPVGTSAKILSSSMDLLIIDPNTKAPASISGLAPGKEISFVIPYDKAAFDAQVAASQTSSPVAPTRAPTSPPTVPPTVPPTLPPTAPPTLAPVAAPTTPPPTIPGCPASPTVEPPTTPPSDPPTNGSPVSSPTPAPTVAAPAPTPGSAGASLPVLSCEYKTSTGTWSNAGCTVVDSQVALSGGGFGTKCSCNHATEYAVLVRQSLVTPTAAPAPTRQPTQPPVTRAPTKAPTTRAPTQSKAPTTAAPPPPPGCPGGPGGAPTTAAPSPPPTLSPTEPPETLSPTEFDPSQVNGSLTDPPTAFNTSAATQNLDFGLDQYERMDLIFVLLYVVVLLTIAAQTVRVARASEKPDALLGQHVGLLIVALLRMIMLSIRIRGVETSITAVIFISTTMYCIEFCVFFYVVQLWITLGFFSMAPNQKDRAPKYAMIGAAIVFVITFSFPIAIAAVKGNDIPAIRRRADLAKAASYTMAVMAGFFCLTIVASGYYLSATLGGMTGTAMSTGSHALSRKILGGATLFALSFLGSAVCWVMSVTNKYALSWVSLSEINAAYFTLDIVALLTLVAMLAKAVGRRVDGQSKLKSERSGDLSATNPSGNLRSAKSGNTSQAAATPSGVAIPINHNDAAAPRYDYNGQEQQNEQYYTDNQEQGYYNEAQEEQQQPQQWNNNGGGFGYGRPANASNHLRGPSAAVWAQNSTRLHQNNQE